MVILFSAVESPVLLSPGCISGVHPRLCGGTQWTTYDIFTHTGLSPPVWGNLRRSDQKRGRMGSISACAGEPGPARQVILPVRSIPACAGEPCLRRSCAIRPKVYPRLCGGTIIPPGSVSVFGGLSPPVRGNPATGGIPPSPQRSIPACAGEPGRGSPGPVPSRVYPRLCGGTRFVGAHIKAVPGLSPPVRGNYNRGAG